ncbi:Uncharacterized conserved protein, DUF885 familyt [Salegentibacter salegens]|uniref:Uncharacterized conserved protein, DUF885 familyt n=2 Tax=Salegentibacter salegens TaxID=143223 RepID=A0A1M7NXL2_9FLAO|nr:DUF885 domain-containing protein [Salegentibacter salegens]PRX46409.1 uncharacterized protein (DUF885 family) [Salegentibacter salegens]SHN08968.1 Uncharacterized conserved protein, DUF885 familyt [Salegentibacter salegens]
MIRFIHKFFFISLLFMVISCDQKEENYSKEEIAEHSAALNEYFEEEFQKDLEESPMMQTQLGQKTNYGKWDDFSHLKYAEDRKKAKNRLEYLKKVDVSALNEQTRLSYDLYRQKLENELADYDYRFYNYPVNQMFGYHAELPAFLINMHRIDSVSDAEAYIARLKGIPKVMEEVIGNLKIREQNGIVPPVFVFDRVLESSRNVIKGKPFGKSLENSALLSDFKSKIADLEISKEQEKELIFNAENVLVKEVKPAYENLISFLETQQKRANNDAGAWKFPKGDEFYASALKRTTTTNLSAQEIHQIGLDEVARIHGEMETIKEDVGFEGTLQDFFEFMRTDEQFYYASDSIGRQKYLAEATDIINTMKANLDELFITKPEAALVVKAVEPFREKSAGKAFYQQPAKDGSRPGTYYANLYDMAAMPTYQMEALAYHEGIPGHHMQIAIAQELEDIPQFRKFSFYTAYVEGWGLYSEFLPKEIGYYKDPYSDFGRLAMELWRSCRLVVDTGIHAKKWTRQEGIEYYKQNTPNAESDCVKMVERHIVMPGQATAYKIGMNKILELRGEAEEKLGEDFDIREFHEVILLDGALPLNILEEKVDDWISGKTN